MKTHVALIIWYLSVSSAFIAINYRKGHLAPNEVTQARTRTIPRELSLPNQSWIFLNPDCPCGRASFEAFESLVSTAPSWGWHVVLVCHPSKMVQRSDIYFKASANPSLQVHLDDGELAEAFQVERSGHVVLIGAEGSILFEGGVTPARGHLGDCRGKHMATQALLGTCCGSSVPPVFGCPLIVISDAKGNAR